MRIGRYSSLGFRPANEAVQRRRVCISRLGSLALLFHGIELPYHGGSLYVRQRGKAATLDHHLQPAHNLLEMAGRHGFADQIRLVVADVRLNGLPGTALGRVMENVPARQRVAWRPAKSFGINENVILGGHRVDYPSEHHPTQLRGEVLEADA